MKKITLILITLFAFIYANAQYTVPRGLPYHDTRWIENKGVAGATYLFDSIVMFRNIADTQMKPLYPAMGYIQNFDGDSTLWIWDKVRWKKLGGGAAVNDRFGIEDNLGIQDRAVDMQEHSFILNNSPYNGFYDNTADALFEVYFPTSGSAIYLQSAENNIHAAGNNNMSGATNNLSGNANTIRSTGANPNIFLDAIGSGSGAGKIAIRAADNTPTTGAVLHTDFITNWDNTTRDFQFPKASGTFVLSVNGNLADSTGNVTISTGSGTVTSFSSGNLSPLFTTSVATATTTPALTFALTNAAGGTVFGNNTGSSAAPAYTAVPVLGIAGTTKGTIGLAGNTSGVITIQPQAAAGTFNFNLPITAGTSGYLLTSAGGGSSAMTWTDPATFGAVTSVSNSDGTLTISPTTGAVVASLNLAHANTWSAKQTFATGTTSLAPINIPAGTLTTGGNISNGNVEFNGTHMYMTIGGAQVQLDNQLSSFALAAIGSSPNANGATYSSPTFNLEPASASFGGVITTTTQTMGNGAKTFTQAGNDAFTINGSWTSTANNQVHFEFTPAQTFRATTNDVLIGMKIAPSVTFASTGQNYIALDIAPTFAGTAGQTKTAIRAGGDIIPSATTTWDVGKTSSVWANGWFLTTSTNVFQVVSGSTFSWRTGSGVTTVLTTGGDLILNPKFNAGVDANYRVDAFGEIRATGGITVAQSAAPSFAVTQTGTGGATSYTYVVQGVLLNGSVTPISTITTATGNATLSGANGNVIAITVTPGIYQYKVYRSVSGGTPATVGLINTVSSAGGNLIDNGLAATTATPTNTIDMTGYISTFYYKHQSFTSAQITAMIGMAAGDEIYCSDCTANDASTGVTQTYNGSAWKNSW